MGLRKAVVSFRHLLAGCSHTRVMTFSMSERDDIKQQFSNNLKIGKETALRVEKKDVDTKVGQKNRHHMVMEAWQSIMMNLFKKETINERTQKCD